MQPLRAELQKVFWDDRRALNLIRGAVAKVSREYPGDSCFEWGRKYRPIEFSAAKAAQEAADAAFISCEMPALEKHLGEYLNAWMSIYRDYRRACGICD